MLLVAAVATGIGMWRVLMEDTRVPGPVGEQISRLLTQAAR